MDGQSDPSFATMARTNRRNVAFKSFSFIMHGKQDRTPWVIWEFQDHLITYASCSDDNVCFK